jgi:glycosyltransferase involved in cell wall biosynthesis
MRVLFVCNDLDYWLAHRAALAERVAARGHDVRVLCGAPEGTRAPLGIRLFPIERHRVDPLRDVALGRLIARVAAAEGSEAVHLITLKPALYGALALRGVAGVRRIVATFAGLGRAFDPRDERIGARLRRGAILAGLRRAFADPRVRAAFENAADRDRLLSAGAIDGARTAVVGGAGLDLAAFPERPLPSGPLRVLHAGRLLRAKGAAALIEAGARLRSAGAPARIVIAGWGGGDPDAVSEAEVAAAAERGDILFRGRIASGAMAEEIAACHLVALPTLYPEGLPRILVEAASTGRAAIVSATPGCLGIVRDGVNGVVLPDVGAGSIAAAIAALADAPERVAAMAAAARRIGSTGGFDIDAVADAYCRLYGEAASARAAGAG